MPGNFFPPPPMASPQKENGFTPIAHELLEALIRSEISLRCLKVWLYLARNSFGYARCWAPFQFSNKIAEDLKMDEANVRKAIHLLITNGLLIKQNDRYVLVKDYDRWSFGAGRINPPKRPKFVPPPGRIDPENRSIRPASRVESTRDINKVVKEREKEKRKETYVRERRALSPKPMHVDFIERFAAAYELKTGQPFDVKQHHYVMVDRLIKSHGFEAVTTKIKIFIELCENASAWFTRERWGAFTIENFSKHWNSILTTANSSESFRAALKREGERRARVDELIRISKEGRTRR